MPGFACRIFTATILEQSEQVTHSVPRSVKSHRLSVSDKLPVPNHAADAADLSVVGLNHVNLRNGAIMKERDPKPLHALLARNRPSQPSLLKYLTIRQISLLNYDSLPACSLRTDVSQDAQIRIKSGKYLTSHFSFLSHLHDKLVLRKIGGGLSDLPYLTLVLRN
jgi:hypothetical protein